MCLSLNTLEKLHKYDNNGPSSRFLTQRRDCSLSVPVTDEDWRQRVRWVLANTQFQRSAVSPPHCSASYSQPANQHSLSIIIQITLHYYHPHSNLLFLDHVGCLTRKTSGLLEIPSIPKRLLLGKSRYCKNSGKMISWTNIESIITIIITIIISKL